MEEKLNPLDKEYIKGFKNGLNYAKKICLEHGFDFTYPDVDRIIEKQLHKNNRVK